jgi:hypothetical protein
MKIKDIISAQAYPEKRNILQVFIKVTDDSTISNSEITTPVPDDSESVSLENIAQMVTIDESHELFDTIKNKFNITFND